VSSLKLALNKYAFHWSFPEILADELGLFKKAGLHVHWRDATPANVVDKTGMYTDLLSGRQTDVYHAGEWVCINRVARSDDAWIVAASPPGPRTLNSTFALFVRRDSKFREPRDLAGQKVAIESGTGSYYTALMDLERHLPAEQVNLLQVGEPHRRLMALLDGKVAAASLLGPWSPIARRCGARLILMTERKNPTTLVTRKDMDVQTLGTFLHETNRAIRLMNAHPVKFRESYFRRVRIIIEELPQELRALAMSVKPELAVPRWKPWRRYALREFRRTSQWMLGRGMLSTKVDPKGKVADFPDSVYG
jgi:ABC-type nitrate/sulfonate/bicarbonate transport system substrate-binding protein